MRTDTVKVWGNGHGIRVRRAELDAVGLTANSEISIRVLRGKLVITPEAPRVKKRK